MIYLDGSALCRFLPGVRHSEEWTAWVESHLDEVVTSQLGLTELRQASELYPRTWADDVRAIVDAVRSQVRSLRFDESSVELSSHATAVLKPFAALHVGAAVSNDAVTAIATYDPALAHVAEMYELRVFTPGLEERWHHKYQGPPEDWGEVELDAPYDPGAEFVAVVGGDESGVPHDGDVDSDAPVDDVVSVAEVVGDDAVEVGDVAPEAAGADVDADEGPQNAVAALEEALVEAEAHSELERALREAEARAVGGGFGTDGVADAEADGSGAAEAGDLEADVDAALSATGEPEVAVEADEPPEQPRSREEILASLGEYQPQVEAWKDPENAPPPRELPVPSDVQQVVEERPVVDVSRADASEDASAPAAQAPAEEPVPGDSGPAPAAPFAPPVVDVPHVVATDANMSDALVAGTTGAASIERSEPTPPTTGAPAAVPPPLPPNVPVAPPTATPAPAELPPDAPPLPPGFSGEPQIQHSAPPPDADPRDYAQRSERDGDGEAKPLTIPIQWNIDLDEPEGYEPASIETTDASLALRGRSTELADESGEVPTLAPPDQAVTQFPPVTAGESSAAAPPAKEKRGRFGRSKKDKKKAKDVSSGEPLTGEWSIDDVMREQGS